jgi:antitoxin VapB
MQTGSRHVRLFRNSRNQAVRTPVEFELPGDEAILRREGDELVIEAPPKCRLLDLLATWEPLDEGLPEIADEAVKPEDVS